MPPTHLNKSTNAAKGERGGQGCHGVEERRGDLEHRRAVVVSYKMVDTRLWATRVLTTQRARAPRRSRSPSRRTGVTAQFLYLKTGSISFHSTREANREPRICLANPVCTHSSNRCLVFVAPELNQFRMKYHFFSKRCFETRGSKILCHIQLIRLRWTYLMKQPVLAISDAPQGPVQPMQVEPGPDRDSSGNPPDNVDTPDQAMDDPAMHLTDLDNSGKYEYLTMKARFELTCFKICEPFSYGRIGKKKNCPSSRMWP